MRLKALFVSPAGAAYGSERSMLALLKARQFEAEVVCPGGGVLEQELRQLGVKVFSLEFGKYSVRQNPLWHVGFYRRFQRILQAGKPDVVVINLDGNTPLVTMAAVQCRIPIIRFSRFEFRPPTRWIDRWCWLKAREIICPSELVKRQVLAWAPPEFHRHVHCFYDSYAGRTVAQHETAAFRAEFGLRDDRVIGCIGRLHRGKRIETAIEALAEVRKQVGNARLLVIGDAGSSDENTYKNELQQLASGLGLREAVTFTGFRAAEDMPAAIASLDVCVLPSESESFGMVLMESWAQGVPTVASDIGGCSEITNASGGGYLAPVGDVGAFAGQLLALLTDSKTAMAMGQKGKAWVDQNCACNDYAARFESVTTACKYAPK
jgi:glycosyltransferase involved in cell wall biosynthesis